MNEHIDYIELRGGDLAASRNFYSAAFGWSFVDYGPGYAAFEGAGIDGGLDGAAPDDRQPLIILKADDLADALARVEAAGGTITDPIFEFPGGRRFHFRDPSGNVLGVWAE